MQVAFSTRLPIAEGSVHQDCSTLPAFHLPRKTSRYLTDPPYYDNIGYADLLGLFLRLAKTLTDRRLARSFRRLDDAQGRRTGRNPFRHGGNKQAEAFFMARGEALSPPSRRGLQRWRAARDLLCLQAVRSAEEGITSRWMGIVLFRPSSMLALPLMAHGRSAPNLQIA